MIFAKWLKQKIFCRVSHVTLKKCPIGAKHHWMREQNKIKKLAHKHRNPATFNVVDKVLVQTHIVSNKDRGFTSKFARCRDGPYTIKKQAFFIYTS